MANNCLHENFQVSASVHRLTQVEGGPVTGYTMDVEVHCTDCMMPFLFKGLPGGVDPSRPTCNVERNEARMPIEPVKIDQ